MALAGRLEPRRICQVYCTAADTFTLIRFLSRAEVIRLRQQRPADGQRLIYQQNLFTNVEHVSEPIAEWLLQSTENTATLHVLNFWLNTQIANVDRNHALGAA